MIYLEDLREGLALKDKLYGLFARYFSKTALRMGGASRDPNSPAVILFTSGSEGLPKGVVLSHRNLQANRYQAAARIAFTASDIVFNALPMFHAFGLTGGALLPVLAGVRTFLYPSPLHYKVVPELCYDTNATVLFGTDTFLMGYARSAHPYDFFNVRLVVAGAERVKPETREVWMEKFGLRILEGYGATECAPVVAVNTPMHFRTGTVGRLLDQIEYRLEPVPGIEEGGRLFVKGPNIMLGYLRAENPGVIEAPPDGWYDTGDIVKVDEDGFVTILGRAKRFCQDRRRDGVAGAGGAEAAAGLPRGASMPWWRCPTAEGRAARDVHDRCRRSTRKAVQDELKAQGATALMVPRNVIAREGTAAARLRQDRLPDAEPHGARAGEAMSDGRGTARTNARALLAGDAGTAMQLAHAARRQGGGDHGGGAADPDLLRPSRCLLLHRPGPCRFRALPARERRGACGSDLDQQWRREPRRPVAPAARRRPGDGRGRGGADASLRAAGHAGRPGPARPTSCPAGRSSATTSRWASPMPSPITIRWWAPAPTSMATISTSPAR